MIIVRTETDYVEHFADASSSALNARFQLHVERSRTPREYFDGKKPYFSRYALFSPPTTDAVRTPPNSRRQQCPPTPFKKTLLTITADIYYYFNAVRSLRAFRVSEYATDNVITGLM